MDLLVTILEVLVFIILAIYFYIVFLKYSYSKFYAILSTVVLFLILLLLEMFDIPWYIDAVILIVALTFLKILGIKINNIINQ